MKITRVLRRVLTRRGKPGSSGHARQVDEQRAADTAKAWERPGGPIDPGFVA